LVSSEIFNFIYRLKLEDAGTFWYHPHFNSSEQLERGSKGVFIVEEAEKLPWSQELTMASGRLTSSGRWNYLPTI
jgi:FtsP/CotA-like multicopper oxidase with cupredoxin domain